MIEENRKTLEELREREKGNKQKAKQHWDDELKRVQSLKKKQDALESNHLHIVEGVQH